MSGMSLMCPMWPHFVSCPTCYIVHHTFIRDILHLYNSSTFALKSTAVRFVFVKLSDYNSFIGIIKMHFIRCTLTQQFDTSSWILKSSFKIWNYRRQVGFHCVECEQLNRKIWIFNVVIIDTNSLSLIIGRECFPLNYFFDFFFPGERANLSHCWKFCTNLSFCSRNGNTL